ncbi:Hypothetical protein A7982_06116 [Minicystis rosea]|nr:Hypothetical protein A7982_06116 [Minicystis rosea]
MYGGYSPEPMSIHAFDLLMRAASIESYAYRYFFEPPSREDASFIQEVLAASAQIETRIAGRHALDDWRAAVEATLHAPERGKRLLRMTGANG